MNRVWKRMFDTFGFVAAAMLLFISPSTAWSVENIDIRYLVQGKKVIPLSKIASLHHVGHRKMDGMEIIIARVGNRGNSGAPHLHFQLMDSRNFLIANGLPMMFENVPAQVMIAEFPVTGNTLSFSDSIFSRVR